MLGITSQAHARILVVQDEPGLSSSLSYILEAAGYQVQVVGSGEEALRIFPDLCPDLVLLDTALPDLSGFDVCRRIRASAVVPQPAVVILTAETGESERVAGFEVGADDFVSKPFSLRELMLRIEIRLRARKTAELPAIAESPESEQADDRLVLGPLEIDQAGHRVFLSGEEIDFSVQEMRLLAYMASSPGRMHTRRELLTEVWGYRPDVSSRTLDTHIKRIRDKFGSMAWMIQTVHGVGYRLAKSQQRVRRREAAGGVARRR
jgi:two-component system, OmpR family, phosphate regulon response regulator PhoB